MYSHLYHSRANHIKSISGHSSVRNSPKLTTLVYKSLNEPRGLIPTSMLRKKRKCVLFRAKEAIFRLSIQWCWLFRAPNPNGNLFMSATCLTLTASPSRQHTYIELTHTQTQTTSRSWEQKGLKLFLFDIPWSASTSPSESPPESDDPDGGKLISRNSTFFIHQAPNSGAKNAYSLRCTGKT